MPRRSVPPPTSEYMKALKKPTIYMPNKNPRDTSIGSDENQQNYKRSFPTV